MTLIHVVGIGLDGAAGLTDAVRQLVDRATLLVGSSRHLSYFPHHPADRLVLGNLNDAIAHLHSLTSSLPHFSLLTSSIVILASGDPLFFGLGRLLLTEFPAKSLTFHPHLSAIQLAFSRLKLSWQDARVISAHGRSLDELIQVVQQGIDPIAVLTDGSNTPSAIARLLDSLDLPSRYQMWVCENLGGPDERIVEAPSASETFAPLNVVVLRRVESREPLKLPLFGIPDRHFLSFPDRPGLMTKRDVRVHILAELDLQPPQVIWDIGAGTGSVSIELARLCPSSQIYAIEKTAMGSRLIQQNCQRFQVDNVHSVSGAAPAALTDLPTPDRVFIGGSGGQLCPILDLCHERLAIGGRMLLALATLEHLTTTLRWLEQHSAEYTHDLVQLQVLRSVPIANLTRLMPLNPVTLVGMTKTI